MIYNVVRDIIRNCMNICFVMWFSCEVGLFKHLWHFGRVRLLHCFQTQISKQRILSFLWSVVQHSEPSVPSCSTAFQSAVLTGVCWSELTLWCWSQSTAINSIQDSCSCRSSNQNEHQQTVHKHAGIFRTGVHMTHLKNIYVMANQQSASSYPYLKCTHWWRQCVWCVFPSFEAREAASPAAPQPPPAPSPADPASPGAGGEPQEPPASALTWKYVQRFLTSARYVAPSY